MNPLLIGTVSFAAASLVFGLTYVVLRGTRAEDIGESNLLVDVVCVALTTSIAMAIAGHVAFAFDWRDELAALGVSRALGYAALDLGGLVVAIALVGFANRRAARKPDAKVVQFNPGPQPTPANTPRRPGSRRAA
ncbi:MAG: hypothetical protein KDK11_12720 [Maritimibacter sp.]|nr:hypothetical protein [Maritimibacter sp.]